MFNNVRHVALRLIDACLLRRPPRRSLFLIDDHNHNDGCLTIAPFGGRVWLRRLLMLGGYSVLLYVYRRCVTDEAYRSTWAKVHLSMQRPCSSSHAIATLPSRLASALRSVHCTIGCFVPKPLFQIIFCLNSMFAWLMKTPVAIKQIEKWSHGYLEMDCAGGKCYGVLAVSHSSPCICTPFC